MGVVRFDVVHTVCAFVAGGSTMLDLVSRSTLACDDFVGTEESGEPLACELSGVVTYFGVISDLS